MEILVTNDDGIKSAALWALVAELSKITEVMAVAPDRERSAIGTAVTLRHIIKVRELEPPVHGAKAYSVDGTPSDSIFLALGKLNKGKVGMVVSGINQGLNLGEDAYISGTVSGALQGYLHGLPSLAISADCRDGRSPVLAARLAFLLVGRIVNYSPQPHIFLNVNVPDLPAGKIRGIKLTRLASESHINTVDEVDESGEKYYWLVRQRAGRSSDRFSDILAIEQGCISITPLYFNPAKKPLKAVLYNLCHGLLDELQQQ